MLIRLDLGFLYYQVMSLKKRKTIKVVMICLISCTVLRAKINISHSGKEIPNLFQTSQLQFFIFQIWSSSNLAPLSHQECTKMHFFLFCSSLNFSLCSLYNVMPSKYNMGINRDNARLRLDCKL